MLFLGGPTSPINRTLLNIIQFYWGNKITIKIKKILSSFKQAGNASTCDKMDTTGGHSADRSGSGGHVFRMSLNEISKRQKEKYYMVSRTYGIKKQLTQKWRVEWW